jgi:hypothetical protein
VCDGGDAFFYGVYEKEGGEAQLQGGIAKPMLERGNSALKG